MKTETPNPTAPSTESTIERRSFLTTFKRAGDDDDGRHVFGYAAMFNSETDMGWFKEIIEAGAFDEAISASDCRALFNHDANCLLARQSSKTLTLKVDNKGLHYEFKSPNTTIGNDILEMMERGDLKESSFAFTVKEQEWKEEKQADGSWDYTRVIKKVDRLYDVSPVTYPAYGTTTVAKRSLENWKKEHPTEEILEETEILKNAQERGYQSDLLKIIFG